MHVCEVFVTNSSLNVNQLYSYCHDGYIEPYKRVEVYFSNGKTTALCVNCYETDDIKKEEERLGFKLSGIIRVIDEEPVISDEQFELAKWLSRTTVSPFISCLNTMLPKVLRTSRNIKTAREIEYIRKNIPQRQLTKRQQEVFDGLMDGMTAAEARKTSVSIIKKFIDEGIIEIYKEEILIHQKIQKNLEKIQYENYLREKVKVIREELGDEDDDIEDYIDAIEKTSFSSDKKVSDDIADKLMKEVSRLSKMPFGAPEAVVVKG